MTTQIIDRDTLAVDTAPTALYAVAYITAAQPVYPSSVEYCSVRLEPSATRPHNGVHMQPGKDGATIADLYIDGVLQARETFPLTWDVISPALA